MGLRAGHPPAGRSDGDLIALAEVRHIYSLEMGPVWDVASHPPATDRERPGSFRKHDIEAFPVV